jgi:putative SOS response-associated peptidase YedK
MCGRYALKTDPRVVAADFNVAQAALAGGILSDLSHAPTPITQITSEAIQENFNVAPTHQIPVILEVESGTTMAAFSWGLVPSWSKDPSIGSRMINARSETVLEKPSFRSAMGKRRCIIPADGWFEWQKSPAGKKIPHYFSALDNTLIGFAGLYESWKRPDGEMLWSCTILTKDADPEISYVHDRMPVFVHRNLRSAWLQSGPAPLAEVLDLSCSATQLQVWEVGSAVGNVRNNGASLIEPGATLFD